MARQTSGEFSIHTATWGVPGQTPLPVYAWSFEQVECLSPVPLLKYSNRRAWIRFGMAELIVQQPATARTPRDANARRTFVSAAISSAIAILLLSRSAASHCACHSSGQLSRCRDLCVGK